MHYTGITVEVYSVYDVGFSQRNSDTGRSTDTRRGIRSVYSELLNYKPAPSPREIRSGYTCCMYSKRVHATQIVKM